MVIIGYIHDGIASIDHFCCSVPYIFISVSLVTDYFRSMLLMGWREVNVVLFVQDRALAYMRA